MTPEIFYWLMSASLAPALTWAVYMTWMSKESARVNKKLLEMHEQPDKYGFGTGKTNVAIEDSHQATTENTSALRQLTHYIKWQAKEQTGKNPPPPIDQI